MSSRTRKKKPSTKKEVEEVTGKGSAVAKAPQPSLPAPPAKVESRHAGYPYERLSRGFSRKEVEGVGLTTVKARTWGLRVDDRRRSQIDANVKALKEWVPHSEPKAPAAAAPKKAPRRTKRKKKSSPS